MHIRKITIPARKFARLFDYVERIGLDARAIAATVDLNTERIVALDPEYALPALQYSRVYKAAAAQMELLKQPSPWGAGVGSESFDLMCHCMINARTLREALLLAERFDKLLSPVNGYRVRLLEEPNEPNAKLCYDIDLSQGKAAFIPVDWGWADSSKTVARASGLRTWHALCGWLIGQVLTTTEVLIDAPPLSRGFHDSLVRVFHSQVVFNAGENALTLNRNVLDRRIVHTTESLAEFLKNSVYHLIAVDSDTGSTTAAIKSLVTLELIKGPPSFADMASMLYMSESSLRRRLQGEQTSYQAIKDEVRCELAIDKLLHENTRVADLAELLGFAEASSFVRSFKSWTGYTPKCYKDKIQSLAQA
jgi:AraC-like DNA-binding protein